MKKYLPYIIILFMGVTACQKNNDKADLGDPDKRLNTLLADYQSKLVAPPYGWVLEIVPDTGENDIIYPFWFRFQDSNRVVSTWNGEPAFTSSYRLKALQRPELIFDTYTYLHELSNPEPGTLPNTVSGNGLYSDFEFEILSASTDSFVLQGKYNGSYGKLLKAAATDSARIVLPGYALAYNNYTATITRILYATTAAAGTIAQTAELTTDKTMQPLRFPGVVAIPYADLGASGWQYQLTYDETTHTITTVQPNATMNSGIMQGSFKVLESTFDTATGNIYLKTSYTNAAGAERVTEELLTLY